MFEPFGHLRHVLLSQLIIRLLWVLFSLLFGRLVHGHPGEEDDNLLPEVLAEHALEDLDHSQERAVETRVLAVDSDDKEIDKVAAILQFENQLGDDLGIVILVGVVKADGVNQGEGPLLVLVEKKHRRRWSSGCKTSPQPTQGRDQRHGPLQRVHCTVSSFQCPSSRSPRSSYVRCRPGY